MVRRTCGGTCREQAGRGQPGSASSQEGETDIATRNTAVKVAVLVVLASALAAGCCRQQATPTAVERAEIAPTVVDARPGELDLYISTAYADSLSDLVELFHERRPNVTFHERTGDARSLVTEIREGARPDVFMSAGDIEVKPLEADDLVGLRRDFCFMTLGIIAPKGNPAGVRSLEDLAADATKAVALAPADSSIGHYALKLLKDEGLWDKVEGKVMSAEVPSGALDLVTEAKADACLAYGAPLRTQEEKGAQLRERLELVGDLTAQYCVKIPCPALSARGCAQPEVAEEFIEFLTSDGAQDVLARHGFLRLKDPCCSE